MILAVEEYDQLLQEKAKAERDAIAVRDEVNQKQREIERIQWKMQTDTEEAVSKINEALTAAKAEAEHQRILNQNLLRISRERANADRHLKPKKQHSGYVVVTSRERTYRYRDGNYKWQTAILWETVLQTPYTVDLPAEQAKSQTEKDLFKGDKNGWMIGKIGITGNFPDGYEEMLQNPEWQNHGLYNVMLERQFLRNYKTGYWEIIFTHTKSLGEVPQEMRLSRR